MNLVYFILIAFGLTQILVFGSILDFLRPKTGKLAELFHCSMCLGFWVGVFLWGINGLTELFNFDYSLMTGFLLGCLSSGTSYVFSMLFCDDGLKMEIKGINIRPKINYRRWK